MRLNVHKYILYILTLSLAFFACQRQQRSSSECFLRQVENHMIASPDSALLLLQDISCAESLVGELQARYCLLQVMAHDKNYMNIVDDDSLLTIASNYYQNTNNNVRKAQVALYQGRIYEERKEHHRAVGSFLHSLDLLEGIESDMMKGILCAHLGTLYLNSDMYKEALDMFKKGYMYAVNTPNYANITYALRDLGRAYTLTSQTDSMIYYYEHALGVAHKYELSDLMNDLLSESSYALMMKGMHDSAIENVKKVLSNEKDSNNIHPSYLSLGYIYWDKKEYDEAKVWLLKSISHRHIRTDYEAYQLLSVIEAECNNYEKAYEYQTISISCKDTIEKEQKDADLLSLQHKFDNEKLKSRVQQIEYLSLNQRFVFLLAIVLLLCVLVFVWWLSYRNKQRRAKEVSLIKQQLSDNFRELDKLQRRLYVSNQELECLQKKMPETEGVGNVVLDSDRHQYNRSILLKHQQLLEEIENLQLIQKQNEEKSKALQYANKLLEGKLQLKDKETTMASLIALFQRIKYSPSPVTSEQDWLLLSQFEDMFYNSFSKKIGQISNLTLREKRVCLLLRLGVNNSDMAKILCIEVSSVIKYKTRVKDKIASFHPSSYSLYDILSDI